MKVTWDNQSSLPTVSLGRRKKSDERQEERGANDSDDQLYLFSADEDVSGQVEVILPANTRKLEHNGIKAEMIGQIELAYDRGNHYVFLSTQQELAPPSILTKDATYRFAFKGKDTTKEHESYHGINVKLRYFVRVRIQRSYGPVIKEFEFCVQKVSPPPEVNNPLKMEVGIEDCLHIEFEYDKSKYHLKEIINGKINFVLVRIKITHMELQILRRETTGSGPNLCNETEAVTKFEIMDGAPIKGETIPIRVFLEPHDLTPTLNTVHNKFSVKYYLNLVLVDEEERRYFKQQEIILWRKDLKHSQNSDPAYFAPNYHDTKAGV
ncbi:vacuolar protein sorting protein [Reticulomyxa filosa]|uniref:Vacuolar protein sorting protein n=1 Tax=Reticulomyxa filosa TaxID=46433 RepID=X6NJH5_RETFI|nr:vacuolar protein sorting protein [Reticulomyxa filosa]|eukprot:ETO26073.1 vacuolar protein sorting protein [Reticulomyxa filosa]